MEGKSIIYIAIVDTRMVLEYHALTSISPLASVWLLDIGAMAHMCNNCGLFITSILSRYMSNPSLEHFQVLKKLYRYLLGTRLALKYIGILEIYIILGISLDNDIYLNTYNNLDWDRDKDNYYFIISYFFKIADKIIS